MKLGLSVQGSQGIITSLNGLAGAVGSDAVFELIKIGQEIRDKAKEILEGKTNPEYSTGKLRNSIKSTVVEQKGGADEITSVSVSVGPDMREAPYAEWVEFGHYMTGGYVSSGGKIAAGTRWWEGHHYMEGAWTEISANITTRIKNTLSVSLNNYIKSGGSAHRRKSNDQPGRLVGNFK